jgi:rhodanese-related sulfurtransferase
MKSDTKRLAIEMAAIVLVAAVVGVSWNHRLLLDVWHGRPTQAQTGPRPDEQEKPVAAPTMALPLGLMQVKELFDTKEALIVDARDRDTYRKGHIRGATSIPLGEADRLIPDFAARTPKERLIVVYCGGYDCHDSRALGESILAAGFGQVFIFEGGYPEWKDAGYPVEEGG